ncbi:MAG TPA: electron transfer flavoprotein subunit beta/FixA family protein [Actinomycetota bacterium]|nr:electron transfer flavoprotein subunit beta/FixA family protein [Actinomycetota bacterium]
MNIVVCVKHIPDPNLPPEMDGHRLKREGVAGVLDPGDEFGVEAGLQLKEAHGGEVALVSMGPAPALEAIKRGLSMGADKGVLVTDEALPGADALVTAKVLAAAIKRNEFDLVIAGVESTDGYTGTMPATLAELLDLPQVTFAKQIESDGSSLKIQRQTAEGYHVVECPLPALITVTAGVNEPRYASFKGIMAAKNKPVEQLSVADLGLGADDVAVKQEVAQLVPAEERKAGEVITDDGEAAARIADFLVEAKVI